MNGRMDATLDNDWFAIEVTLPAFKISNNIKRKIPDKFSIHRNYRVFMYAKN